MYCDKLFIKICKTSYFYIRKNTARTARKVRMNITFPPKILR